MHRRALIMYLADEQNQHFHHVTKTSFQKVAPLGKSHIFTDWKKDVKMKVYLKWWLYWVMEKCKKTNLDNLNFRCKEDHRTPKKGLFMALFNSLPAEWSTAMSTFSLGRYKNSPPSIFSNPQSSRNSTPPFSFPTRSCRTTIEVNHHQMKLDMYKRMGAKRIVIKNYQLLLSRFHSKEN